MNNFSGFLRSENIIGGANEGRVILGLIGVKGESEFENDTGVWLFWDSEGMLSTPVSVNDTSNGWGQTAVIAGSCG